MKQNLRIAMLHPNLGIGGAEQLMVNLAVALQQKGHDVTLYTTAYNPSHCFPETRDGTLKVEPRFAFLPFRILGKFFLLMSTIKMILMTLWVLFFGGRYDLYIVDINANVLPFIWLFRRRSIFYLHFPDKLLNQQRGGILRRLYRGLMDTIEELSLWFASKTLVNSQFTLNVYKQAFKFLQQRKQDVEVLYPAIDFEKFKGSVNGREKATQIVGSDQPFFLSLNRYERKKNIGLAIQAFAAFQARTKAGASRLVIAGGYDLECRENVEHELELKALAQANGVANQVVFLRSISHEARLALLENCACLLYTPENEHFGIVPVEAMYMGRPVICHNSGGPKESVGADCGFLLEKDPAGWAEKMAVLYGDAARAKAMGAKAKTNVERLFSFKQFAEQSDRVAREVAANRKIKAN